MASNLSWAAQKPITPTTLLGVKGFFERYRWDDVRNHRYQISSVQVRVRLSPPARKEYEILRTNWGRNFPTFVVEVPVFGRTLQAIRAQLVNETKIVVFTPEGRKLLSGFQKPGRLVRWDR